MKNAIFIGRGDLAESLQRDYPDVGFTIVETGDIWQLDRIVAETRGIGRGTAFMNRLCKLADDFGKKIVLTPDLSFGASGTKRLERFYGRFGFVKNTGRRRDYTISQRMLRHPNLITR